MANNSKYAQLQPFTLYGSGASVGDTSVVLSSFNDLLGVPLTMASFGTEGYGTIEPNTSQEEQIGFTGITNNANGTVTLTGVTHVLFISPYTETSGLGTAHAGGVGFVISNTAGFYNRFTAKNNDETITGLFSYPSSEATRPRGIADTDTAVLAAYVTFGQLGRTSFAGTVNASTIQKGIVQIATGAQLAAGTGTGSTGAVIVPAGDSFKNTSAGAGDATKVPVLNASGLLSTTFLPTVPIANGGTSQITQTAGFDALSPLTTKGDIIVDTGTHNVRQAVGSNNQVIVADSAQTNGLKWAAATLLSGNVSTLLKVVTPVTLASSVTETNMFTTTIPAGALGTTGGVKGKMYLKAVGYNTNADNITFRVYVGSTAVTTLLVASTGAVNTQFIELDFLVLNSAAAVQVAYAAAKTSYIVATGANNAFADGTGAVDTTSSQTFKITAQWNNSSAANTLTMQLAEVEYIL